MRNDQPYPVELKPGSNSTQYRQGILMGVADPGFIMEALERPVYIMALNVLFQRWVRVAVLEFSGHTGIAQQGVEGTD